MGQSLLGGLLVLTAALIWSFIGLVVKSVAVSSTWFLFTRCLIGAIFLSPFIFRKRISPVKSVIKTGVVAAVFIMCCVLTTRLGGAAMSVSMQYAAPMYLIVFTFFRNKKIEAARVPTVLLMFVGLILNILSGIETAEPVAVLTGIGSAVLFIVYASMLKGIKEGSPLGIISAVNFVSAGVYFLALPIDFYPYPSGREDFVTLLLAGVLISGVSYGLYGLGIRRISVESSMLIALAEPLLNPVWVFLFLGEPTPAMMTAGLLFILAGALYDVAVRILEGKRERRKETSEKIPEEKAPEVGDGVNETE